MSRQRNTWSLGCWLTATAVLLGALGAHKMREILTPERLAVWETASRYQMYAGLGLQLAALRGRRAPLLAAGGVVFAGSLYGLCLSNLRWLGAVTPIGGVLMIIGWVRLALPSAEVELERP